MQLVRNVPGQQLLNAIDGMIGDMGQHIAQISLRINAVQPGAADERVHGRSALATTVSPHEQEVLASQAASPQGIFGDVIVDFGNPVLAVIRQGLPLVEHVVDRFGRVRVTAGSIPS
jgi:dihydrodipicolinate reductase